MCSTLSNKRQGGAAIKAGNILWHNSHCCNGYRSEVCALRTKGMYSDEMEERQRNTKRDETVLTGRYCFQLNSLLRGSWSAEMSEPFHLWKHSAAEQLLRAVKCFHCIVPSWIRKAADFDLWKTLSEDTASAACKTPSAAPYEHYPSPPIKSHRNMPFPNSGVQGENTQELSKQTKWIIKRG